MKIKLTVLVTLISSIFIYGQLNSINDIHDIIQELKTKYAPDKRVALFDVEILKEQNVLILSGETNIPEAKEELMEKIKIAKFNAEDQIILLPEEKLKGKTFGLVNLSAANLRSSPRHPAELTTQALLGTVVKVLKCQVDFYLIQTPDQYISWVDEDGIVTLNQEQLDDWNSNSKIIYINDFGFVYSKPDGNSQRVSDIVIGNILIQIGSEGDFVKVQFPDKRIGYIKESEVLPYKKWMEEAKPTKENIIETAHKFVGIPYLWGGTSAKAMDCSGFTKTVYFLNGVVLDRDASQQVNKGILVDTENGFDKLEKGDLLFFGFKETEKRKERITHVGIYIGNLEFIHEAGLVKINSFDKKKSNFSKFRLNHFIRARRIITSLNENGITMVKDCKFYNGEL